MNGIHEERNLTMLMDFYEMTMAGGYFEEGYVDKVGVFDMFFRSGPDGGGFAIAAGLEQFCEVIDNLIRGNTIVLTMDELDGHLMQRAVDTLSGAVFALHATIRKASDKTYLIAPSGVEVNETYDVDRRF